MTRAPRGLRSPGHRCPPSCTRARPVGGAALSTLHPPSRRGYGTSSCRGRPVPARSNPGELGTGGICPARQSPARSLPRSPFPPDDCLLRHPNPHFSRCALWAPTPPSGSPQGRGQGAGSRAAGGLAARARTSPALQCHRWRQRGWREARSCTSGRAGAAGAGLPERSRARSLLHPAAAAAAGERAGPGGGDGGRRGRSRQGFRGASATRDCTGDPRDPDSGRLLRSRLSHSQDPGASQSSPRGLRTVSPATSA